MNARQKAKKYKRIAEENAVKAAAYDRHMRADAFRRANERRIIPLHIMQILPDYDYMPQYAETRARELIAQKLGEFLIENNLVVFEVSKAVGLTENLKKITATLTVLEPITKGGGLNEQ